MKNKIYDEQNGLWYEQQGEHYIPCLGLPEQKQQTLGMWGQKHLQFLKEHRRGTYTTLLTTYELNGYLTEIDKQANEMFSLLVNQLVESEGVTEELKAQNQLEWVQRMNNVRMRAIEMVTAELIYK